MCRCICICIVNWLFLTVTNGVDSSFELGNVSRQLQANMASAIFLVADCADLEPAWPVG